MELQSHYTYLSIADYQRLEEETQQKYEYHDGEVFAMAGADLKHNAISGNAIAELNRALRKEECNVFTSDQKVRIDAVNRFLYPDVSVTCGSVERSEKDTKAIINPILLIEVLSDSTESYDRGDKFALYSKLPSLQEYVLVQQHRPAVQIYYRATNTDLWQITWIEGLAETIRLQSVEAELSVQELYLKTDRL